MARAEFRVLHFISIFDEHVYDLPEGGRSKLPGVPSTSRGQIEHMLEKRTTIDGQDFPVYLLASEPEQNRNPHDEWDSKWLRDKAGEWHAPYEAWLRVRQAKIEEREERADVARKEAARRMGDSLMKGLSRIAADGTAADARADARADAQRAERKRREAEEKRRAEADREKKP